jgi:hypothetical protein
VCVRTPEQLEIDLHRAFCSGPFGLAMEPADCFAEHTTITIAGRDVPALGPVDQFLHACYHLALSPGASRWTSVRDVAEIVVHRPPPLEDVAARATRWRGTAVVGRALEIAEERLGVRLVGPIPSWATSHTPTRFERLALRQYGGGPQASYAVQAATGMFAVRGVTARAAYARALLFPQRSYLRGRDASYVSRWRRALGLARRWSSR